MSSAGILARQVERWKSRKPLCFREGSSVESVTILTTAPAFVILFCGVLIASSVCVVENFIERYLNRRGLSVELFDKRLD